jgi:hypothetical protein
MSKVGGSTGQSAPSVQYTQSSQSASKVQESKEQTAIPSENSQTQKASKQEATSRFSDYQLEGQARQAELNSKLSSNSISAENAVYKTGEHGAQTVLVGDTDGPEEYSDTDGSDDYDTTTGAEDMPPAGYEENSNWVHQEESEPETEALRVELMVQEQTNELNKMMVDAIKAEKAKLAEKAEIVQNKIDSFDRREAINAAIEQYGIDVSDVKGKPKYDKSLGRLEGRTASNGEVSIGPAAFRSAGYLASSIGHEAQHAKQVAEGRLYTGKSSQGEAINEIESYDWELKNASKHGLTEEEINIIKGRRQKWMDELDPVYKEQVAKGNYTWP